MSLTFDLVVPLYNEERNVAALVGGIAECGLSQRGLQQVVLLDNGSTDGTLAVIQDLARTYSWIKVVHLAKNLNYGGGVYEGFRHTRAPFVGYVPGDNQVHADDISRVWDRLREVQAALPSAERSKIFVKGRRTTRHDGFSTRLTSVIYTVAANVLLGLRARDVNGLPKIFGRELLDRLPEERMVTFTFDAQLLAVARAGLWTVEEVPVTFHARRAGVSSWSSKRLSTYKQTAKQVWRLRSLRLASPKPLALSGTKERQGV